MDEPTSSLTHVETQTLHEMIRTGEITRRREAGGAGAQIVPDIASAMPTVTGGGLTYTFHVRPNVMFSPPVSRPVKH